MFSEPLENFPFGQASKLQARLTASQTSAPGDQTAAGLGQGNGDDSRAPGQKNITRLEATTDRAPSCSASKPIEFGNLLVLRRVLPGGPKMMRNGEGVELGPDVLAFCGLQSSTVMLNCR